MTISGTPKCLASTRYQSSTVWQMLVHATSRSGGGKRPTGVLPLSAEPMSVRA